MIFIKCEWQRQSKWQSNKVSAVKSFCVSKLMPMWIWMSNGGSVIGWKLCKDVQEWDRHSVRVALSTFITSHRLYHVLPSTLTSWNSNENFSNKSSTFGSVFLHLFAKNHHSVYSHCIKWWHLFNELIITSCGGFRFSTSTHFMSSNQGQSCKFYQPYALRHISRQAKKNSTIFLPQIRTPRTR